jgi:transposase
MAAIDIWRKRVAEWRGSGLSAARFCEKRGFSAASLYGWSHRIGSSCEGETIRIARVERSAETTSVGCGEITIEFAGARVRIPAGADAATVGSVLRALRAEVRR